MEDLLAVGHLAPSLLNRMLSLLSEVCHRALHLASGMWHLRSKNLETLSQLRKKWNAIPMRRNELI
jgi:hypothetical protein